MDFLKLDTAILHWMCFPGRCCQTLLLCTEPGHRKCEQCACVALHSNQSGACLLYIEPGDRKWTSVALNSNQSTTTNNPFVPSEQENEEVCSYNVIASLIFLHLSVSHSVHGGGACVAGGDMHGRGHVWQGACLEGGVCGSGACMAGGICGMGGLAWQGGIHVSRLWAAGQ